MPPWFIGIFFFLGLIVFLYFLSGFKSSNKPKSETPKQAEVNNAPKKQDIVLAEITEKGKDEDYGILWNGKPGETYNYTIVEDADGTQVASGTSTSASTVFKIRGIPLEYGKTYTVKVGDTTIQIPFSPPSFDLQSMVISGGTIDCNTSSTPTNIEAIVNGIKLPMSAMQIKIEPPGFIINEIPVGNVIIMIYNGPNSVNILNLDENVSAGTPRAAEPGQTLIPF